MKYICFLIGYDFSRSLLSGNHWSTKHGLSKNFLFVTYYGLAGLYMKDNNLPKFFGNTGPKSIQWPLVASLISIIGSEVFLPCLYGSPSPCPCSYALPRLLPDHLLWNSPLPGLISVSHHPPWSHSRSPQSSASGSLCGHRNPTEPARDPQIYSGRRPSPTYSSTSLKM